MDRFLSVGVVVLTILAGVAAYAAGPADSSRSMDPSKHVSMEYRGVTVPDSMAFTSILRDIRELATASEDGLEGRVFINMNMEYSPERRAWYLPRVEERKYSPNDIRELAALFLDVANEWNRVSMTSQRELLCPEGGFATMEKAYAALERRDSSKHRTAELFLDYTMERIGERASADLRAWLSREKRGIVSWRYNYRGLWAGHEYGLDTQLSNYCGN